MLKLNRDVILQITKEFHNDTKFLYSCILVNRIWCETAVEILWKNPGKYQFCHYTSDDVRYKLLRYKLLNVMFLHLSEESRDILKSQEINIFTGIIYQQPLFDYISFWKHLDLDILESAIIYKKNIENIEESKISIIRKELIKLFVNRKTKFTHLYIYPYHSKYYQTHLIPGAECCFSELQFLYCCTDETSKNILEGLARISRSIKKLKISITWSSNNSGIIKLIEVQKNLVDIEVQETHNYEERNSNNGSICKTLEESLIKHADTVKYLKMYQKPVTKILSYLVNLVSLKMYGDINYSYLENVSLPVLKIIKAENIPPKYLAKLIENTKGHLTEICSNCKDDDNKRLIQAIYKNCPKLKYLKLSLKNSNISELERLLVKCQYLNGLVVWTTDIDWKNLFEILTKSSPNNLFKFKFYCHNIESLKLFFDNWKGRHPMLLHTNHIGNTDLIKKYEAEGIVKEYVSYSWGTYDFEWISSVKKY